MTWTYGEYSLPEDDYDTSWEQVSDDVEKASQLFYESIDESPVYIVLKSDGSRRLGIAYGDKRIKDDVRLYEVPYSGEAE
jgi:hypothetical protein